MATSGLKKDFPSHHASNQDSVQTLRHGNHNSCSSLRIRKTKTKPAATHLLSVGDDGQEGMLELLSYDTDLSQGTLSEVVETYWGLSS